MIFIKRLLFALIFTGFLISCERDLQQPVIEYIITNPADTGARFPNLHIDDTETIHMSWFLKVDEDIYALQFASLSDDRWTDARSVRVGTNFFVNWADFPSVVGKNGEVVAAHWLRKIEGGPFAYNVNVAFPGENIRRWTDPITPHLDGTPTEHGFVSMQPLSDDRVLAIWLDGRHTDGRGHHEYSDPDKAMTIRSAEISKDGSIDRKRVIDEMVCDCCQTDMVKTSDGFAAVYRGRTTDEIRDILISRYNTETGEWSEPVTVHDDGWQIGGCPVNGPRIIADGNNVAVAWFTMNDNEAKVLLARSDDGGVTFGEPVKIAGDETSGRVDLAYGNNGSIFVSWMEAYDGKGLVMVREVKQNNEMNDPIFVGLTDASRASGFPRMVRQGDYFVFAWTQTEPLVRVRTARIPVESPVLSE